MPPRHRFGRVALAQELGAVEPETVRADDYSTAELTPELWLERTRFEPGETIIVQFHAPVSYPADAWVGIVPAEVAHGAEGRNDAHDLAYISLDRRGSGEMSFTAPDKPGAYDLRMNDSDGGGREVATVGFTVTAAGE